MNMAFFNTIGIKIKGYLLIIGVIIWTMFIPGCGKVSGDSEIFWEITQYGPRDINSSFYTIYHPQKGLIVLDGGWTEDAEYVREIIYSLGGHVDVWILSHPHQDHIGAFNEIYVDSSEITISEVWTVDMPSPEICLETAPWDSTEAYEDFLELVVENLKYVYPGDLLTFHDLKIEILHTYDENVKILSRDYLNDGSMIFKVSAEAESFLFCSDVGQSVSDYLLEKYGDALKADYIQMGHHGYGGLNDDFYEAVAPKKAFFDAPDWLMLDQTGKYDNPENASFMESLGSQVISFNSAPNKATIR